MNAISTRVRLNRQHCGGGRRGQGYSYDSTLMVFLTFDWHNSLPALIITIILLLRKGTALAPVAWAGKVVN